MAMPNKNILLITDSRGHGMDKALNNVTLHMAPNLQFDVFHKGGANINSVIPYAIQHARNKSFDQVYFAIGVNDLTTLHTKGKVTGTFTECGNLVETLENRYDSAVKSLKFLAPKLYYLIGIDIAKYNKEPHNDSLDEMQTAIDTGIPILNAAIDAINIQNHVLGPWLSNTVHCLINGKRVHKYCMLPGGIHPDERTCNVWAKKLISAALKN